MRSFGLVLLAVAVLAGIFLGWQSLDGVEYQRRETAARIDAEQQQLALERERLALQQAQATAPAYNALGLVYMALPLAIACLALYIAADAYKQRRTPLVRPDARGQLPVARPAIEQGQLVDAFTAALTAFHRTQHFHAVYQPQSAPHTFSPHITVKDAERPQPVPVTSPVLAPATDTLPNVVELADVLPQVKPGHLAFGMAADGSLVQLPFGRAYHVLGTGDTRSGKTNALDSVIVQLHHMAGRMPLCLYGADYKQELAATWSRSSLFAAIETEPAAIVDILDELVNGPDGVRSGYKTFTRVAGEQQRVIRNIGEYAKVTGTQPRLVVLVLDEINALLEAAKKSDHVAEGLKVLLQTGAGAGVFVLGGAQYLSAGVFGRDGSKQFVSRMLFGAYDDVAARMLFGACDKTHTAFLDGTPGRGLIRTVQQAQAQPFQALHTSEDDILDAIGQVNQRVCAETMKPRFVATETPETLFTSVAGQPETSPAPPSAIAAIVKRLKAQGKGKTAIIELVCGAEPGATEAYRTASASYDAIMQTSSAMRKAA